MSQGADGPGALYEPRFNGSKTAVVVHDRIFPIEKVDKGFRLLPLPYLHSAEEARDFEVAERFLIEHEGALAPPAYVDDRQLEEAIASLDPTPRKAPAPVRNRRDGLWATFDPPPEGGSFPEIVRIHGLSEWVTFRIANGKLVRPDVIAEEHATAWQLAVAFVQEHRAALGDGLDFWEMQMEMSALGGAAVKRVLDKRGGSMNVLDLYKKWLHTGEEVDRQRLVEQGKIHIPDRELRLIQAGLDEGDAIADPVVLWCDLAWPRLRKAADEAAAVVDYRQRNERVAAYLASVEPVPLPDWRKYQAAPKDFVLVYENGLNELGNVRVLREAVSAYDIDHARSRFVNAGSFVDRASGKWKALQRLIDVEPLDLSREEHKGIPHRDLPNGHTPDGR